MTRRRVRALGAGLFSFWAGIVAVRPAEAVRLIAVAAGAGRFNTLNIDPTYEADWEARFAPRRFRWVPRVVPDVSPVAGVMATSRGTLYTYAGLRFDLALGTDWRLSPHWAAGLYYRDAGRSLGGALEFRSGIELSRRLGWRSRLGLTLYHLSNGGFYERNPGSESLVLTYTTTP